MLGIALQPRSAVFRDTWRVLVASLAFGAIVVLSAGTLMLAISSLSRNSRYVGAIWLGFWVVSDIAAGVLNRDDSQGVVPAALVHCQPDADARRHARFADRVGQAGQAVPGAAGTSFGQGARPGLFRRRRGRGMSCPTTPPAASTSPGRDCAARRSSYPWQWSAGVLCRTGGRLALGPGDPRSIAGSAEMNSGTLSVGSTW